MAEIYGFNLGPSLCIISIVNYVRKNDREREVFPMMKRFFAMLLAIAVIAVMSTAAFAEGDKILLRLANSHNAEHITSQACQMFADLVAERTDGRITIECHFAGELGDERSTIEQCQFGGLDFTRVSSGAAAEFAPLMNAMQMPYLYNDVDHLFEVMDGEIAYFPGRISLP